MVDVSDTEQPISRSDRFRSRVKAVWEWIQGFIFGMTYFEMLRTLRKERAEREHLFVLISFGDLIGIPILPPYYSLRLLPFIVPLIYRWKRRLLRERDLSDLAGE